MYFTKSAHKTETGIQLETGTSGFGNRKFRYWGKNRGRPGQGHGRRVARKGRGGGALRSPPAAWPAGGGRGWPAARGALRPRGLRRWRLGLRRSSPRCAPAAQLGGHGGAAVFRRRRRSDRRGKGSGRMRGSRESSPRARIGRRTAGEGARRRGAELGEDDNGGRRWRAWFRPGNGEIGLGK